MSKSRKNKGKATSETSGESVSYLNRNRVFVYAAVVAVLVAVAIFKGGGDGGSDSAQRTPEPIQFVKQGTLIFRSPDGDTMASLEIEIAKDRRDQQVGLMFRESLEDNQGMLFVYPYARTQIFWMRNERIPLDMVFVDDQLEIVNIHKYTIPDSDEKYQSVRPAMYVLEVRAGLCDDLGVDSTCSIDFTEL